MAASEQTSNHRPDGLFDSTHWSNLFVAAQESWPAIRHALEKLCRTY